MFGFKNILIVIFFCCLLLNNCRTAKPSVKPEQKTISWPVTRENNRSADPIKELSFTLKTKSITHLYSSYITDIFLEKCFRQLKINENSVTHSEIVLKNINLKTITIVKNSFDENEIIKQELLSTIKINSFNIFECLDKIWNFNEDMFIITLLLDELYNKNVIVKIKTIFDIDRQEIKDFISSGFIFISCFNNKNRGTSLLIIAEKTEDFKNAFAWMKNKNTISEGVYILDKKNAGKSFQASDAKDYGSGKNDGFLLHQAVMKAELAKVKSLLTGGADPNRRDSGGFAPIHYVSMAGETNVSLGALVLENKNKIEINYKNEQIFYLPVIKNLKLLRLFILDLLLKAGADINIDSDTGITPLHVASLFPNKLILKLLFEMGADISKKTDQGKTFFDIANSTGLSCFIDHMKFKNFNFIDSNGNNLLWYAVKAKDFKRFEQLIQIKLKTDSLNNHGLSLIDYAKKIHASEENLTISDAFLFLDSDFDILKLPYHYKYLKKESEKIIDYLTEYTLIKNN